MECLGLVYRGSSSMSNYAPEERVPSRLMDLGHNLARLYESTGAD